MFENRKLHIAFFLSFLISVSLIFATIHSHNLVDSSHSTSVEHTLNVDDNYCPVCGYLFKIHFASLENTELLHQKSGEQIAFSVSFIEDFALLPYKGRSPPTLS